VTGASRLTLTIPLQRSGVVRVVVWSFTNRACSYVRSLDFFCAFDHSNHSSKLVQQVVLVEGAPTVLNVSFDFSREPFTAIDE
jgi:hypothetical protein